MSSQELQTLPGVLGYRVMPYHGSEVLEEMRGTCLLLKQWQRWRPIVAGGALWSWAAGRNCRDVDIFVRSNWWTRRRALRTYGVHNTDTFGAKEAVSSYWGTTEREAGVAIVRYSTLLPGNSNTPVDFNLTPWKGAEAVAHFDYGHCAVAFGHKIAVTHGIEYYENGALCDTHGSPTIARSKELVLHKTQPDLWGQPHAGERLRMVLKALERMYKDEI